MSVNDPILEPFKLKHLTLKNRILSTAHEPAYSEDAKPQERYRLYHEEKAKGGIALTFMGASNVSPDSPSAFSQIYVGNDDVIPHFRAMADTVHKYDTAIMAQITHMGRRDIWASEHWLPTVAPSLRREPAHRSFPKIIEKEDIRRIQRDYRQAARRCREGGLDGVELEAYSHLIDQFWSPYTNWRDDEYGGSLENRMRFGMEVLESVREGCGPDFIVGIRMVCDEVLDGGLGEEEGLEIARILAGSGLIDFINVIKGHMDTNEGLSHIIPNMGTPVAPSVALAGRVRRETGLPVIHACRINEIATARYALREGLLDMVGMTRAHIADPHIVRKVRAGQEDRIRPCVGAGYCIDRIYMGGEALCIHNAATGRERTMPHEIPKAAKKRKIVIVGAGPGGLEAARVCAERGHDVVVFEAAAQAGGQIRVAVNVDRRKELIGIVDWRLAELERLGVTISYNTLAGAGRVTAESPDVVIVATGGIPNTSFLDDGEDLVVSSWDILTGQVKPADGAIMYDDNGQHPGLNCAEYLCARGIEFELVTADRMIAQDIGGTNYPIYYKTFYQHNVTVTPNLFLKSVHRDGNNLIAAFYNEYTHKSVEKEASQIIVEHGTAPVDGVYFDLKQGSVNHGQIDFGALVSNRQQAADPVPEGSYYLFRIGDAVASRNIHGAIYDALRLCKDL